MTTDAIAGVIRAALRMGFAGHVAFHWYNEPLLYCDRITAVMDAVPEARYLLWTNGTLIDKHADVVARFDRVVRTAYDGDGNFPFAPDTRLANYGEHLRGSVRCVRPLVEFPIDCAGNVRLCCQDWRGDTYIGNVHEGFEAVADRWLAITRGIIDGTSCPDVCLTCTGVQRGEA
jgi:hypothetical protein